MDIKRKRVTEEAKPVKQKWRLVQNTSGLATGMCIIHPPYSEVIFLCCATHIAETKHCPHSC